ncbi:unnamed protein product [Ectocarpus sp. 6 AP-2014]
MVLACSRGALAARCGDGMLTRLPRLPRLPGALHACFASSGHAQTIPIGQGGRLVIDMAKAAAVVKVTTQWIDSCSVEVSRLPAGSDGRSLAGAGVKEVLSNLDAAGLSLHADEAQAQVTLAHDKEHSSVEDTYLIEAVVPELFSVELLASHGDVSVSKKIKGDCKVRLDRGDINVGIVRGETIRLSTGRGHIKVDELEGNVDITATSNVRARLINGAKVNINTTGHDDPSVNVGALYSSGAHITSAGNVGVSSCHGRIAVHTADTSGSVNLSSVSGTAHVSAGEGGATVHMDVLEEGTASHIRSNGGNINVSLSQQVDADVEITGDVVKVPSTFEGDTQRGRAVGSIYSAQVEPSRATRHGSTSSTDAGGGKIDMVGARGQSLRQYFPGNTATTSVRPKLSVVAEGGCVVVETLSWADNITRKFAAREAATGL